MIRLGALWRRIIGALAAALLELAQELRQLNNVAQTGAPCSHSARVHRVKEWMRERSGNQPRCC